jgi:hypothetical protein
MQKICQIDQSVRMLWFVEFERRRKQGGLRAINQLTQFRFRLCTQAACLRRFSNSTNHSIRTLWSIWLIFYMTFIFLIMHLKLIYLTSKSTKMLNVNHSSESWMVIGHVDSKISSSDDFLDGLLFERSFVNHIELIMSKSSRMFGFIKQILSGQV